MANPTFHLVNLAGLTPEERVLALAKLYEQLIGRKPSEEELAEELRAVQAEESAAKPA